MLKRLTADAAAFGGDADVTALLQTAVLFVVPNMCPDGAVRCDGGCCVGDHCFLQLL